MDKNFYNIGPRSQRFKSFFFVIEEEVTLSSLVQCFRVRPEPRLLTKKKVFYPCHLVGCAGRVEGLPLHRDVLAKLAQQIFSLGNLEKNIFGAITFR